MPVEVEYERVVPVVRDIVKRYNAMVSVDTYRAQVAAAALDAGARIINDISALRFDAPMAPLLARRRATVVLMHMQGTPQTMQRAPAYHQVIDDVYRFLAERLYWAMQYGILRHHIILDPGFGFGKRWPTIWNCYAACNPLARSANRYWWGPHANPFWGVYYNARYGTAWAARWRR